ncbi:hypothetical protein EMPS_06089 [Entomortierella parvispora]|uniref:SANT domain-containing protein n=1 Tax=Entomortierella parvispora TaxID=205924 RepID=A0A9P3HBM3_9FUNG|nr:hypothetical protein EMPS_06089 [Entomortierella parvispora]
MERSPLLSPLQTASSQLKSTRIHSTVSSPGGVQHIRGYSRSPPPPTKPRSESHDRSFSDSRKRYDRSRSPERDDRNRPRDFPTGDRRRPPRAGMAAPIGRNGPAGSPPSEMGFQESRLKYRDRFPPRDPRFRSSESLKGTPAMGDHAGPPTGPSRHFASNSAPNTSTLSHSREFSPPPHYKGNFNDGNHNNRSMEYFPTGPAAGMGPSVGLGLGPMRYMDRDDWRGRPNQFSREFDRERDFRGRDIRQDIRDMRDLRAPRDPREARDMREPPRDREWRDRDMAFNREVDPRDRDPRDRDLREVGINTRDLRDREPRERGAWGAEVKGRDPLNNRDGPEMDVRELVERERERERERDRDRDRHRERPIWLHESEKEREGPGSNRMSFDHGARDRDRDRASNSRMTLAQELDRDLLAYAADKDKQTTEKMDDTSIPDGPAASRTNDQRRSLSVHSLKESLPNGDMASADHTHQREQERFSRRDSDISDSAVREHRDRDRHSSYRPEGAGLRMDFDGRPGRNIPVGRRQRILSAPSSAEGQRFSESFEVGHPTHPARNSYPNSPAVKIGPHSEKAEKEEDRGRIMEGPMRGVQAESDSTKAVSSIADLALPRSPTDVEMQSPPSNVRVSTEDTDMKSPTPSDSKTTTAATATIAAEVPTASPVKEAEQTADNVPLVEKTATDVSDATPLELPTSEQKEPSLASPDSVTSVLQDAKVKQEDVEPSVEKSAAPSIPPQDMMVDQVMETAGDKEVVAEEISQSAAPLTSQPSPRSSPVTEPLDTQPPAEVVEFANHADILVEIDKIDGTIQQYEDILASHRVKKEQDLLALNQTLLSQADDEVPNVVDQSELESVVEDSAMELEVGTEAKDSELSTSAVEPASPVDLVPDRDTEDHGLDIVGSEDIDMGVGEPDVGVERHRQIVQSFSRQDLMAPIDENDPFLKRKVAQTRRPQLFDQIYAENNTKAKKYGRVHTAIRDSSPHRRLQQPALQVFESIEDYPCYQENIDSHRRFRDVMLRNMAVKATALDEKELALKREYKQHWEIWTKKVEKLDKLKEKMATVPVPANAREEDQVVGESVLFTSTRNRRGAYNSDAVRSEAELLEIIQSLENADMRNPDLRASRTAATVPPMILDPNIREKVHYYDMNHLVTDPAKYYRLGAVTDVWSEQEREIFIKRYMNYPKQFGKIAAGLEDKTASQCVLFYYREKKKIGFKEMLSNRGRKRKPAGKRKEKPAQTASPSGQPGKKHKGSALIEDIGQANRTKMAKSKELRELQEMSSSWNDVEGEPGPRRRVRSGAANQASGTPVPDEAASNGASPAPSSALSTPVLSAAERRKQRTRATNSRSTAAKAEKAAEEVAEEKKPKAERGTSTTNNSNNRKVVEEEPLISVDSPGSSTNGTVSKATTLDPILTGAQELATGSVAFTVPGNPAASARWTTAEHAKAIEALKKFGRDFEAVAAAVGTKTVDQCRNFCFNYKRKFGVSALDDANSQSPAVTVDETDEKEMNAPVEKTRGKKGRAANASSVPGTPTTPTSAKDSTASGRRRGAKAVATAAAPEAIKDEAVVSPGLETTAVPVTEEVETTSDKRRRKRTSSKVETGAAQAEGTTPATATSFRALYSRDPPSASASPSAQGASPDTGAAQQTNADGTTRRPNSSSYWSRQEKIDFARLLSIHGKDWDKISKAMKTKTLIQVRNHFSNHAEKLSVDSFAGSEPSGSPLPTLKEEPVGGMVDSEGGSGYSSNYTPLSEAGPKTGYFATPVDGHVESNKREGVRSMSPPRRITNIGNLLNNDDEEIHVAAEDWFGNNEESGPQDASFEEREQRDRHYDHHHSQHHQQHQPPPRSGPPMHEEQRRLTEDEDVETEDELDRSRLAHGSYDTGYSGLAAPAGVQRRASETNIGMGGHGYPVGSVHDRGYYGQSAHGQHPPQHPQHHASHAPNGSGVLGSPYGGQHYYDSHPSGNGGNSGYRSPPPSGGAHGLHPVASPTHSLPPGPTSVVGQPPHYQQPYSHQQHQRSSSIGHSEMIVPRSHPSPQIGMRARSPLSNQGPYYGGQQQGHSHHGYPSSGPSYGYPPQHLPHPPRPMSEQPSMVMQHGHGHSHSHSGSVSRYSSPPGVGGPRNGPGSPVHLEHSGSSGHISHRYSPVPTAVSVTSPRMSDASMHHHSHHLQQQPQVQQQHPHAQHHRRSSSPYQHHIPGQITSPSYLPGPPKQHSPSPRFAYSSASSPASLLPPPLPPSASSSSAPGPGYHPGQHIQQHPSGYGPSSYGQSSQSQHPR